MALGAGVTPSTGWLAIIALDVRARVVAARLVVGADSSLSSSRRYEVKCTVSSDWSQDGQDETQNGRDETQND